MNQIYNGNAALLDQLMNNPRKQVEIKLSVYTLAALGDELNTKNKYIQPEEETILNYSTTLIYTNYLTAFHSTSMWFLSAVTTTTILIIVSQQCLHYVSPIKLPHHSFLHILQHFSQQFFV